MVRIELLKGREKLLATDLSERNWSASSAKREMQRWWVQWNLSEGKDHG